MRAPLFIVTLVQLVMLKMYPDLMPVASSPLMTPAAVALGGPAVASPPRAVRLHANPVVGHVDSYIDAACSMVCKDFCAESSLACLRILPAVGIATSIRIRMMEMTISSSLRVKPLGRRTARIRPKLRYLPIMRI